MVNLNIATFPPIIYGFGTFEVTVGVPSTYNLTVVGGQLQVLGGLPESSELVESGDGNGIYTFTWTLFDITDTPITFIANNEMGQVFTHSPTLAICACVNEGECTVDGILGTENNIFVFECECPEGIV